LGLSLFLSLKLFVIIFSIQFIQDIRFANSELNAAKEKLEIVRGAAPPPAFLAGVLPRRRRGEFALIQGSYTL